MIGEMVTHPTQRIPDRRHPAALHSDVCRCTARWAGRHDASHPL